MAGAVQLGGRGVGAIEEQDTLDGLAGGDQRGVQGGAGEEVAGIVGDGAAQRLQNGGLAPSPSASKVASACSRSARRRASAAALTSSTRVSTTGCMGRRPHRPGAGW
ncbi:MAG: hypothetical protein R3F60_04870 [bacterium]